MNKPLSAIVSIHDVMPHTLELVAGILQRLPPLCHENLILLIVPGLEWSQSQLLTLHHWQEQGYYLAGHGWRHKATHIRTRYHRPHALLVSRQEAEHLSLTEPEISILLEQNHDWFERHGFILPDLYVPPAWAMGPICREKLGDSPFRYFESTSGIYDVQSQRHCLLPLAGFQADTAYRECSLGFWNAFNQAVSSPGRPLRISIHPHDYSLRLAHSLEKCLRSVTRTVDFHEL